MRSLSVNQDRYIMSMMVADNTNDVDDELLYEAPIAAAVVTVVASC